MTPVSVPSQPQTRLLKQLVDYERVHLGPSGDVTVTFTVTSETFWLVDKESGDIVSAPGTFQLVFTNGADLNITSALVVVSGTAPVVSLPFPF